MKLRSISKRTVKLATALLAVTLLAGAWAVAAESPAGDGKASADWPKWRGPNGDGISREQGLAKVWPKDGPAQLWKATVGRGYSSPVAMDGRIYLFHTVDDADTLTCYQADDGKVLWNGIYKSAWTGSYPGTRATPTIEDGRIYTYGGNGDLVCWNQAEGKLIWRTNLLKETHTTNLNWGMASSPVIDGDRIYVQVGKGAVAAVAVNKKDGKIIWQWRSDSSGGYAPAIVIESDGVKQVVIFAGKKVAGLNPTTGEQLWTENWRTPYDVHATTPIYRDGHLFLTSGYNVGCFMLKVEGKNVKRLWQKKVPHSKFPSPILEGDVMYVNSEDTLMCLDWPSGDIRWQCDDRDMRLGAGGSFVRFEDMVITLSERGRLGLVKATPQGFEVVSKTDLFRGGEVWSTPLIYQKRLYCKSKNEFVCLDISAK